MLPSSPPITLQQVYTEFGAPLGTPLAQFYQGGPWVGLGGANANVPLQPPIGLLNLLGAASGGLTSGFIAAVTPPILSATGKNGKVTTGSVTASVSGNTGAVTFQWALVNGDSTIAINSPTAATTSFSANVTGGNDYSGTFQCVCTDSASNVTRSPTVLVTIRSISNV